MTSTEQHRSWNSGIRLRAASGALALAVLLLPAVVTAQSTFHVLYAFTTGTDGANPTAGLVQDAAGNLYGTTQYGGTHACPIFVSCGTVFKLDPVGTETVLYSFTGGADGANPTAGLTQDPAGNFYGTTPAGGASGNGVVFKLDPTGKETVLYSFTGGTDGATPRGLVRDAAGNLYGTTSLGGSGPACGGSVGGCGTVFKLDPSGTETVLYSFTGGADGALPGAGLVRDAAGNLYGTTNFGGSGFAGSGNGVVFKVDTTGKETVLYSFTGAADGAHPFADLVRDVAGNLYSTTYEGGASGNGTVFKLNPTGNETVLHSFSGGADGALPGAGLFQDAAGNLYGTTTVGGTGCGGSVGCGTVFKLDPTGKETVLHSFTGGTDGALPFADLVQDAAGNLYGTTQSGGSSNKGVVFKLGAAMSDFSLSASALTPSTVNPGASSTSTVNVTAAGGFSGSVTLSCSVQPMPALAPQCSVSPNPVNPGSSGTLTITTTGPSQALAAPSGHSGPFYALGLLVVGLAFVGIGFGWQEKKRMLLGFLLCSLLLTGLVAQVACGGGSSTSSSGGSGTPPGAYNVTVTGTSGSIHHSVTVTLTVQ